MSDAMLSAILARLREQFGDDGLRAVEAFLFALGPEALLWLSDDDWTPADVVMQASWAMREHAPRAEEVKP